MLRWVGAVAAIVILVALCSIWRLMQGPIELDWLSPYVEAAMRHSGISTKMALSGVRVWIDRPTHQLVLRAENVRLWLPSGVPLARFPELATSFELSDLLHGRLAPAQVIVERPVVHLLRERSGAVSADIGGDQSAPDLGPQTLEELAGPPAPGAPLGLLHRISIRGATLVVDDRASGRTWRANQVDIAIDRSQKGARGDVSFAVPLGNSMPQLHATYRFLAERQLLDLNLSIDGIEPTAIPPLIPELAQLRHLQAPISGTLQTRIDIGHGVAEGSRLDIALGKGILHSDWLPSGSTPIESGTLRATYAPEKKQVQLDNLALDLGGGTHLSLDGVLDGVTPALIAAPAGALPAGHVVGKFTAALSHVPAARLPMLWPNGLSQGGRDWARANIHDGMIDAAALRLTLDLDPVAHTAALLSADGNLHYRGMTVEYFDGLPPARKVDGTGTFAGHRLVFTPTSGTVNGLKITGGSLQLTDLGERTEWLTIDAGLAGPLKEALEIIDSKPLRFAHAVGLDPAEVGGRTDAHLHFKLPLLAHLDLDQVDYSAKATMTGTSIHALALERDLTDGALALDLQRTGAQLQGTARFDDVPAQLQADIVFHPKSGPRAKFRVGMTLDDAAQRRFGFNVASDRLSGPIAVDATYSAFGANRGEATALLDLRNASLAVPEAGWKKPPGHPGAAKVTLDLDNQKITRIREIKIAAPGLAGLLSAPYAADHRHIERVDIRRLAVGDADLSGVVVRRPEGGWQADIHAGRIDVRPLLKDAANSTPQDQSPPLTVNAQIDQLVFGPHRELHQVNAALQRSAGIWQSGQIAGRYADGHQMSLQFGDGGGHHLAFQSDDLGDLLKLLDVADNVVGGKIRLDGQLTQVAGQRVMQAHIRGSNYQVARAPGLARILALPSLTGLASTLSGAGLPFMSLRGDISYSGGRIGLERLLAFGESIGVTASGSIDTNNDHLELHGTVAPAYALNSLIGNFPIIGPLLGGGSQGLFAANYRLSGPAGDPRVSVNPLSALAPGFLRQLFDPSLFAPPQQAQQQVTQ